MTLDCDVDYWKCKVRNVFGDEPSNDDVNGSGVSDAIEALNQKIECVQKV